MRRFTSLLVFALLLLLASSAFGADATSLFKEGREALKRGELEIARSKFEESTRLDPRVGTLLNLAECEERMNLLFAAKEHLDRAVTLAEETKDERLDFARGRRDSIEKLLPAPPPQVAPAPVLVSSPVPSAPAQPARDNSPSVQPVVKTSSASASPSSMKTIGYGVVGSGLAALAGGAVLTVLALSDNSRSNETCDARGCDPKGLAYRDDAVLEGNLATGFFIGGAALALAGAAVLVFFVPKARVDTTLKAVILVSGGGGAF